MRAPLAMPGAAGVLTYAVLHATSPQILFAEVWAGMLTRHRLRPVRGFPSQSALERPGGRRRLRCACGLHGSRIVGFVLLAGLVATFVGRSDEALTQRPFRAATWLVACALGAAFWVVHWWLARGYFTGLPGQSVIGQGSGGFLLAGLTYSTQAFGTLALVLAVLGLVGLVLLPRRELVTFGAITVLLPLASYLYLGNGLENIYGEIINYWAAAVLFTVYACVPAALSVLPGAATASGAGSGVSMSVAEKSPTAAPAAQPFAARISGALAAYGSLRTWRFVLALLVAVLTYWTTAGGLITLLPGAQVALVVGVSARSLHLSGGLPPSRLAVACLLGIVTGPANMWFTGLPSLLPAALVGWAAFSAGVAAGVWWLLSRRHLKGQWVLWAVVALLIANCRVDGDRRRPPAWIRPGDRHGVPAASNTP